MRTSSWSEVSKLLIVLLLADGLAGAPVVAGSQDLSARPSAVRAWLKSSPKDARAQLARGVLLECLASPVHREVPVWQLLPEEDAEACGTPAMPPGDQIQPGRVQTQFWSTELVRRGCQRVARQAYERALKHDSSLTEARLRLSSLTIRQPRTSPLKNDDRDLVSLTQSTEKRDFVYLASMFLGLGAERRGDLTAAKARYGHARTVASEWPSAAYALAAVMIREGDIEGASALLSKELSKPLEDPWYRYPCEILTPEIRNDLAAWESRQRTTR